MKKKATLLAIPILASTIIGVGIYGLSTVQAEEDTSTNCTEKNRVTNEEREEHRQEREAAFNEKMTEALENGTLTQEQVTAIEAKHEEMKAKKEAIREQDLGREERREAMHEIRDEMRTWIEEQDLEDVIPKPNKEMRRGGGKFGPRF